jgi:hypothetical protein
VNKTIILLVDLQINNFNDLRVAMSHSHHRSVEYLTPTQTHSHVLCCLNDVVEDISVQYIIQFSPLSLAAHSLALTSSSPLRKVFCSFIVHKFYRCILLFAFSFFALLSLYDINLTLHFSFLSDFYFTFLFS